MQAQFLMDLLSDVPQWNCCCQLSRRPWPRRVAYKISSPSRGEMITITRTKHESIRSQMTVFLGSIGSVSLFVAAVGITNTMFVPVMERTREIGILKALGYQAQADYGNIRFGGNSKRRHPRSRRHHTWLCPVFHHRRCPTHVWRIWAARTN